MSFARDHLRSYVDRVCNLNDEIKARNGDKSEVYKEARANGFNPKVLKAAVKRFEQLKTNRHDVEEFDALFDMYMAALLGVSDDQEGPKTPPVASAAPAKGIVESPTRAHARDTRRKQRFSESMDDTKALSAEAAALGLIDPDAHAETVRIADALARKLGAGVTNPDPDPPLPPHDSDGVIIEEPAVQAEGETAPVSGDAGENATTSGSPPRDASPTIPPIVASAPATTPALAVTPVRSSPDDVAPASANSSGDDPGPIPEGLRRVA